MKPNLVAQYQTLVVVWGALLMSQVLFIVMLVFTKPNLFRFDFSASPLEPSSTMILGLAVAAAVCFVLSFGFKRRLYERAVEEQNLAQVQSGLVIALALCEASSLFGLVLAFAFDYPYFFLWFVLGILGMLLHFPRHADLLAAGYKQK
jgi:F0F1-type ATP synthase membrane subunit c/vacuolar-type H+-ATPase subunit K